MSEYLPPPRSLLYVKPIPPEQGGGLAIGCDCGTVTQLIIEDIDRLTEPQEAAFTCDGCHSVHWFMAGPMEGIPDAT